MLGVSARRKGSPYYWLPCKREFGYNNTIHSVGFTLRGSRFIHVKVESPIKKFIFKSLTKNHSLGGIGHRVFQQGRIQNSSSFYGKIELLKSQQLYLPVKVGWSVHYTAPGLVACNPQMEATSHTQNSISNTHSSSLKNVNQFSLYNYTTAPKLHGVPKKNHGDPMGT